MTLLFPELGFLLFGRICAFPTSALFTCWAVTPPCYNAHGSILAGPGSSSVYSFHNDEIIGLLARCLLYLSSVAFSSLQACPFADVTESRWSS
ncbi:hypothetical protein VTK73DRAFT_8757 [Phialemonium thermophilum]|uniref:Secreted protein n=1 Tax=Phialemonium thermophilum TaxID=223376 RepID=A0ABR3W6C2_9PEZI